MLLRRCEFIWKRDLKLRSNAKVTITNLTLLDFPVA